MNANIPSNPNELLELVKGTRYESVAGDERKLHKLFLDEMKSSSDPMTREIAVGIADGTMTWHNLAANSAYRDYLDRSMDAMQQFDFGAAFEDLAAERAATEQAAAEEARRREERADEPVSRGVLRKRK
jgi:hypothetical protein